MPSGLTLDLNDYNNDYNNSKKEERMISNTYKSDDFNITSSDILKWISQSKEKKSTGSGTLSEGFILTTPDDKKYIVRETTVENQYVRMKLSHEISIYKTIQANPNSSKYISKLLYADIPMVHHRNSRMNTAYFIFEFLPGNTLDKLIELRKGTVPYSTIMEWITQLTKAIDFLDKINIIHRDIKPQNIYIDTDNNRPLLFDLETACIKGRDCITHEFRGTREYAPPKALQLIGQTDFSNLKSYEHTKFSDYYSVIKMMEKDFSRIIVPEQRQQLLDYANKMETEILKRSGGYTKARKTQKTKKRKHNHNKTMKKVKDNNNKKKRV